MSEKLEKPIIQRVPVMDVNINYDSVYAMNVVVVGSKKSVVYYTRPTTNNWKCLLQENKKPSCRRNT